MINNTIGTISPLANAFLFNVGAVGEKTSDVSIIYLVAAVMSVILFGVYCLTARKKSPWYILLFASITIVNCGYYALSMSKTLEAALWANRISYLGSVFLPFSMLLIILNVTGIKYKKVLPICLAILGLVVFAIAASPGYSDVYYKTVTFEIQNGRAVLIKEYGSLHSIYLFYLLGYFTTMISAMVYSTAKRKAGSLGAALMLNIAVFVNICVWLIEQLVHLDFEMLSISYIITEMFLLGLNILLKEQEVPATSLSESPQHFDEGQNPTLVQNSASLEQINLFAVGIKQLTPTESTIYRLYTQGASSKDIMAELNIKENTLKYHNKNIYSKLGVSSRKQLLELSRLLNAE